MPCRVRFYRIFVIINRQLRIILRIGVVHWPYKYIIVCLFLWASKGVKLARLSRGNKRVYAALHGIELFHIEEPIVVQTHAWMNKLLSLQRSLERHGGARVILCSMLGRYQLTRWWFQQLVTVNGCWRWLLCWWTRTISLANLWCCHSQFPPSEIPELSDDFSVDGNGCFALMFNCKTVNVHWR